MTGAAETREPASIGAIFSTGRAGSTWLGSILDTHPDVVYRFEPLSRLRHDPAVQGLRDRISKEAPSPDVFGALQRTLAPAHPLTCKPPFFPKRATRSTGRSTLWLASRVVAPLRPLYRVLYSPTGPVTLVFKEVGLNRLLLPLVRSGLRSIYLIRHPGAVVASNLRGQSAGLMPTGRRAVLSDLLERHDAELAGLWGPRLATASPAVLEALLWRIEVEEALSAIEGAQHVKLVVYEDLCLRPDEIAQDLFAHFGLEPSAQTSSLLEEMRSTTLRARRARGERGTNAYFSVFRDSREAVDRWKKDLTAEEVRAVFEAVAGSKAYVAGAEIGGWTD